MTTRPLCAGLLIPVDLTWPLATVQVRCLEDIRVHLDSDVEVCRYDHDALMFVDATGRIDGQPMNVRATRYIKNYSAAAGRNADLRLDTDPTYGLYGDVVVVGNEPVGHHGVPARIVEWFEAHAGDVWECPRCGSYSPNLHPAVQHEGEVATCLDDFHGQYRPRDGETIADMSRRLYGDRRR